MKKCLSLLLFAALFACDETELDFPFDGNGTQIEIYLVKEDAMDYYNPEYELSRNDLEAEPWQRHSEIEFYDWSAHTFYLKNKKTKSDYRGRYFSIAADEKPIVTGFFYSSIMSYFPPTGAVIINTNEGLFFPEDVACLTGWGNGRLAKSLNEKQEFRQAMENSGLLKEGINVELLDVKKSNSTTLKYTFKVTNLDTEPVYVMDPQKMGVERFHYYTNGVSLYKDDEYFHAEDFETTASDKILPRWYTRLVPGKSMTRTVTLGGFKPLPSGNVTARFSFPGDNRLDAGEWKKNDGRIWVGTFNAEAELVIR
jgi:hypothetical protein